MSRIFTNKLLDMIDNGLVSNETIVMCCLKYMSEDDVKDMMHCNELIDDEDSEDEE